MSQSCFKEIWGEPPQFSMGLLGVVEGMWVDGIARELSETMKLKRAGKETVECSLY